MHWENRRWTSGDETIASKPVNGEHVIFDCSGYFDAGYGWAFTVKMKGKGNFDLIGANPENVRLPSYIHSVINDPDDEIVWARRSVDGVDVIVNKNPKGEVINIFAPLDPGMFMKEREIQAYTTLLCGSSFEGGCSYTGTNNEQFRFNADGTCIFNGENTTYKIGEREGVPQPLIILANDRVFYFEISVDGIDIFNTSCNDDVDVYEKDILFMTLHASKSKPRWAYLSDMVLYNTFLAPVADINVLRLMRNEMFARKGYIFSSDDLNKYFESCTWYQPGTDNDSIQLNQIETLNISFLKYKENAANGESESSSEQEKIESTISNH